MSRGAKLNAMVARHTPEHIAGRLTFIQAMLEAHYDADEGYALVARLTDVGGYMAESGKLKADAEWAQRIYCPFKASSLADEFTGFYNLAVDKVSPCLFELGEFNYQKALHDLTKILDNFKRCIDLQLWDAGYEFWADNNKGIFTI